MAKETKTTTPEAKPVIEGGARQSFDPRGRISSFEPKVTEWKDTGADSFGTVEAMKEAGEAMVDEAKPDGEGEATEGAADAKETEEAKTNAAGDESEAKSDEKEDAKASESETDSEEEGKEEAEPEKEKPKTRDKRKSILASLASKGAEEKAKRDMETQLSAAREAEAKAARELKDLQDRLSASSLYDFLAFKGIDPEAALEELMFRSKNGTMPKAGEGVPAADSPKMAALENQVKDLLKKIDDLQKPFEEQKKQIEAAKEEQAKANVAMAVRQIGETVKPLGLPYVERYFNRPINYEEHVSRGDQLLTAGQVILIAANNRFLESGKSGRLYDYVPEVAKALEEELEEREPDLAPVLKKKTEPKKTVKTESEDEIGESEVEAAAANAVKKPVSVGKRVASAGNGAPRSLMGLTRGERDAIIKKHFNLRD